MKSYKTIRNRFVAKGDKEIEKSFDVEKGAVWHVVNKAGDAYSVLVDEDGLEVMSMPIQREQEMLTAWAKMLR